VYSEQISKVKESKKILTTKGLKKIDKITQNGYKKYGILMVNGKERLINQYQKKIILCFIMYQMKSFLIFFILLIRLLDMMEEIEW
jgi:hypothetical protein